MCTRITIITHRRVYHRVLSNGKYRIRNPRDSRGQHEGKDGGKRTKRHSICEGNMCKMFRIEYKRSETLLRARVPPHRLLVAQCPEACSVNIYYVLVRMLYTPTRPPHENRLIPPPRPSVDLRIYFICILVYVPT